MTPEQININEATQDYITACDDYTNKYDTLRDFLEHDRDVYKTQLTAYLEPVIEEFKVDIFGEVIFIETWDIITDKLIQHLKDMSLEELPLEINPTGTSFVIIIRIRDIR